MQVCQLDAYFTDLHWYPLSSKKNQAGGTDVFAVGCTNGTLRVPVCWVLLWASPALHFMAPS